MSNETPRGADETGELPEDVELRRLYRGLPSEEPRAEIDAMILEAARRATRSPAKPRSIVRRIAWVLPLAAAAGIVLTLSRVAPKAINSWRGDSAGETPTEARREAATDLENERESISTKKAKVTRDEENSAEALDGATAAAEMHAQNATPAAIAPPAEAPAEAPSEAPSEAPAAAPPATAATAPGFCAVCI